MINNVEQRQASKNQRAEMRAPRPPRLADCLVRELRTEHAIIDGRKTMRRGVNIVERISGRIAEDAQ